MELDAIVIGGGQAGLATGYMLQRAKLRFVILEAEKQPVGSWPRYYDSLTLFSSAAASSLPGLPFPGKANAYPKRDDVVDYLLRYASHWQLPILTESAVTSVTKQDGRFVVETADQVFVARSVVTASGSFGRPFMPRLLEQDLFGGQILHSSEYQNPEPFRGQRIVVLGGGNSGVQIAAELANVARVTLATRRPIRFQRQQVLGQDVFLWVNRIGFDRVPLGHLRRLQEPPVVIDFGLYKTALRQGKLDRRPVFTTFTSEGVQWTDGSVENIDAVLFATGYRSNLGYLEQLGALDEVGEPVQRAGVSLAVAGLYFVGLTGQRTLSSATLRGVGTDAAYVVSHARRYLAATNNETPENKRTHSSITG